MTRSRAAVTCALGVVLWLALGVVGMEVASAQTPSQLPCTPPITVCPTTKPPRPSPTPTPSRTTSRPTPSPSAQPSPEPTLAEPTVAPPIVVSSAPEPSSASAAPSPITASSAAPTPTPSDAPKFQPLASGRIPLAAGFAAVVAAVLAAPVVVSLLAHRLQPAPAHTLARPAPSGGMLMHPSSRWRLWFGVGALGLAALVGVIGWYKISGERLLNFQVPLLASAGLAVVLLSVLGGSMLVADQMRGDDRRLDELEEAVRALAAALAPSIEAPPRRSGGVVATEPVHADDDTPVDATAVVAPVDAPAGETEGTTTRSRRSRPTS